MKFLVVSLITLCSFTGYGQTDLLTKVNGKYHYKGNVYKCVELGVVYKIHRESLDLYKSGLRLENVANISAIIGVPLFLLGISGVSSENRRKVGLGALAMGSAVVLELLAIFPRIVGDNKINKARTTFNFEMIERHGFEEDVSISFSQTANGLGFVLNF